jgi:hypothetical protein
MTPTVEVLGVHPVKAREPCHLVEIVIRNNVGKFDQADFTQVWPGKDRSSWQVAYDATFLESDGSEMKLAWMLNRDDPTFWRRDIRLAFFFHYLRLERPLQTPLGEVSIPAVSPRPERLAFMRYSPP